VLVSCVVLCCFRNPVVCCVRLIAVWDVASVLWSNINFLLIRSCCLLVLALCPYDFAAFSVCRGSLSAELGCNLFCSTLLCSDFLAFSLGVSLLVR